MEVPFLTIFWLSCEAGISHIRIITYLVIFRKLKRRFPEYGNSSRSFSLKISLVIEAAVPRKEKWKRIFSLRTIISFVKNIGFINRNCRKWLEINIFLRSMIHDSGVQNLLRKVNNVSLENFTNIPLETINYVYCGSMDTCIVPKIFVLKYYFSASCS